VNKIFKKELKGRFSPTIISRLLADPWELAANPTLTLDQYLGENFVSDANRWKIMPKLRDEVVEEANKKINYANGDDSIRHEEIIALEDSALERIDQYMDDPQQNWETRVGELLAEVNAGSNVAYDLWYSDRVKLGQFHKIENSIYYLLSEKIDSQQTKVIAYNFSDLPFPMFIAYLVYSSLTSNLLNDPFTYTYVEGRLTPEEYSSFDSKKSKWKEAFSFLFYPRLQNYCFKESNNLSKHNLLMMWTIFLKYYCQKNNFCPSLYFDSYEPDRTARTATRINGDAACNFFEFLGV
jgi:hypothetical protein